MKDIQGFVSLANRQICLPRSWNVDQKAQLSCICRRGMKVWKRYTLLFTSRDYHKSSHTPMLMMQWVQILPPLLGHLPRLCVIHIARKSLTRASDTQVDFVELVLQALSGMTTVKRLWLDDPESVVMLQRWNPLHAPHNSQRLTHGYHSNLKSLVGPTRLAWANLALIKSSYHLLDINHVYICTLRYITQSTLRVLKVLCAVLILSHFFSCLS